MIEIHSGVTIGGGIVIGNTPVVIPTGFFITEDNNDLITEDGNNLIED
jgi:hypothetical protein